MERKVKVTSMQNSILNRLSSAQLRRAASLRDKIEALENKLAGMLGIPSAVRLNTVGRKTRTMSAAARKKISAAAKARWERFRAANKKK